MSDNKPQEDITPVENRETTKLAKSETKKLSIESLKPSQFAFVQYYLDIDSPTYNNAGMSYLRAYYPKERAKVESKRVNPDGTANRSKDGTKWNLLRNELGESFVLQIYRETYKIKKNPKILSAMKEYIEEEGFNDVSVDKVHSSLIHSSRDERVKVQAIKEYNRLKWRVKEWNWNQVNIQINDIIDSVIETKDNLTKFE